MFSIDNIVLDPALQGKLSFLNQYGVTFGEMFGQGDGKTIVTSLLCCLMLILFFQNTVKKLEIFRLNYKSLAITITAFLISVLSLNKTS